MSKWETIDDVDDDLIELLTQTRSSCNEITAYGGESIVFRKSYEAYEQALAHVIQRYGSLCAVVKDPLKTLVLTCVLNQATMCTQFIPPNYALARQTVSAIAPLHPDNEHVKNFLTIRAPVELIPLKQSSCSRSATISDRPKKKEDKNTSINASNSLPVSTPASSLPTASSSSSTQFTRGSNTNLATSDQNSRLPKTDFVKIMALFKQKQYEEIVRSYGTRRNAKVKEFVMEAHAFLGRWREAIAAGEEALRGLPRNEHADCLLSLNLLKKDHLPGGCPHSEWQKLRDCASKAPKNWKALATAYSHIAGETLAEEDFDAGLAAFWKCHQDELTKLTMWSLAISKLKHCFSEDSLSECKKLEMRPGTYDLWRKYGFALAENRRLDEAANAIRMQLKVAKTGEEETAAYAQQTYLFRRMGLRDEYEDAKKKAESLGHLFTEDPWPIESRHQSLDSDHSPRRISSRLVNDKGDKEVNKKDTRIKSSCSRFLSMKWMTAAGVAVGLVSWFCSTN